MGKERLPEGVKIEGFEGKEWDRFRTIVRLGILYSILQLGVMAGIYVSSPPVVAAPYRIVSDICGSRNFEDCLEMVKDYLEILSGRHISGN